MQSHYGMHDKCFCRTFQIGEPQSFGLLTRKDTVSQNTAETKSTTYLSSFFAGNYRKYEAFLGSERYLLKFQEDFCPELAPVEYFCNQLASAYLIPVPKPFGLILIEGEYAYAVKNFMQNISQPHTLNHICHYLDKGEQYYTVENLAQTIYTQTQSLRDQELFLKTLLFDALIGNHDRHGRNLGLIQISKGISLAPIYDNTSALGLEKGALLGADWNPLGKITTKNTDSPNMSDYVIELLRLNYKYIAEEFLVQTKKIDIIKLIKSSPLLSVSMQDAIERLIIKRTKELENALND